MIDLFSTESKQECIHVDHNQLDETLYQLKTGPTMLYCIWNHWCVYGKGHRNICVLLGYSLLSLFPKTGPSNNIKQFFVS